MTSLQTVNHSIPEREIELLYGATPALTYQQDKRFCYFLYVPASARHEPPAAGYPLVVLVHGTARTVEGYRSGFAEFAEEQQCILLLPLFPVGIDTALDLDEYKRLQHGQLRYDQILLGMVDEVATIYPVQSNRFLLHGFSGGGQFTHRFLYLHPDRLRGVSVGAPGSVTLVDDTRPWWVGTKDVEDRFGIDINKQAIADVPVLLVIGERDTNPDDIQIDTSEPAWMEGINETGSTRQERIQTLQHNLSGLGCSVRHAVVPGVGHEGLKVFGPVREFFADQLATRGSPWDQQRVQ